MAIRSLDRLSGEKKPFALFLSVGVPHDPWTKDNVPAKYYQRYANVPFALPSNWSDTPDKYMDRNTDRLLEEEHSRNETGVLFDGIQH